MSKKNVGSWFDFGRPSKLKNIFIVTFGILYFIVWIPLPFIFPWQNYIAGPLGIPMFVWVIVLIQILVGIVFLIMIFLPQARALYENDEED